MEWIGFSEGWDIVSEILRRKFWVIGIVRLVIGIGKK